MMGLQNHELLFGRTSPCVLAVLGRWSDAQYAQTVLYQSEAMITRQLYVTRGIRCRKTYVAMSKMLASMKGKRYRHLGSEVDIDSTVLFYTVLPAFRNWSLEDLVSQYHRQADGQAVHERVRVLCTMARQYDLSHSLSEKLDSDHCFHSGGSSPVFPPSSSSSSNRKTSPSCTCRHDSNKAVCIETEPDPHLDRSSPLTINQLLHTLVPNGFSSSSSSSCSHSTISTPATKTPARKKRKRAATGKSKQCTV